MPRKPDDKSAAYFSEREFKTLNDLFKYLLKLKFPDELDVLKPDKLFYDRVCELTRYSFKTIRNWYLRSGKPKISEYYLDYFCNRFFEIQGEFGNKESDKYETYQKKLADWVKPICKRMKWEIPDIFINAIVIKEEKNKVDPGYYIGCEENIKNQQDEMSKSTLDQFENPDINPTCFLPKLEQYYSDSFGVNCSIEEHILFRKWQDVVHKRVEIEKSISEGDMIKRYSLINEYFSDSWWEVFELTNNKYIKRTLNVMSLSSNELSVFLNQLQAIASCPLLDNDTLDVGLLKYKIVPSVLTITLQGVTEKNDNYNLGHLIFSFEINKKIPSVCRGYIVRFYPQTSELHIKLVAIKKVNEVDCDKIEYGCEQHELNSDKIPNKIKEFLTRKSDLNISALLYGELLTALVNNIMV